VSLILDKGFTVEDIILVVNDCYQSWFTDEKMRQFLTPTSILRTEKFEAKLERARNRDVLRPSEDFGGGMTHEQRRDRINALLTFPEAT
jgi:hypothetical protein